MQSVMTSTSAPSSFQLRWGLRCKKSTLIPYSVHFGASDRIRRVGILRADAGKATTGDESESRDSKSNSNESSVDKFGGWFGEDDDGGSSDEGRRFGGVAGVVLAGIFLAGGLAFASLSLKNRKQTGFKPEMQPLTTEQEILLSSDSKDDKMFVEEKSDKNTVEDDHASPKSGIDEEHNSHVGSIQSTYESKIDVISEASLGFDRELGDVSDVNIEGSHDEDVLVKVDSVVNSTIPEPGSITNELPIVDSDDTTSLKDAHIQMDETYSFKDAHRQIASDNIDASIHFSVNDSMDHMELSTFDSKPPSLDMVGQDEKYASDEPDKFGGLAESGSQTSIESLSEKSPTIEPDLALDRQDNHENLQGLEADSNEQVIGLHDNIQALTDDTMGPSLEDIAANSGPAVSIFASTLDQKDEYEFRKDTVDFALEENSPNDESYKVDSSSVFFSSYTNETDFYQQDETTRSLQQSSSILSENSFSHAGIPAPSVVSPALQVQLGKVLVPAVVDPVQGQALAALQVLKVIEAEAQPGDICTRREYARWLVSASSILSRSTTLKVYPAMYVENACDLAFDDITLEDPDFPYIQGLAEAGLISSKLSLIDNASPSLKEEHPPIYFSPESPLSRQDLVSWKMALEKRGLPEVDRKTFYERSGYLDVDRINPNAWPAIVADLSSGENGIIALAFGYTRLFQPQKPVTKAQAAAALSTGDAAEIVGEELARIEAESLAEAAVVAHGELVAEVERDLNASFEKELALEREKIDTLEKLANEARLELEKLKTEREEENNNLIKRRAAVESEMEILSKLRNDVEEQLHSLLSKKMEIAFERDRVNKLREEAERENVAIVQLQYELEVERKALAMARAWAEEEAKRAREQAQALEVAREQWGKHGIKVVVDEELRESASVGVTWQTAASQVTVEEARTEAETIAEKLKSRSLHLAEGLKIRAEHLVEKLKILLEKVKGKSAAVIDRLIQKITAIISALKYHASEAKVHATEAKQHFTKHIAEVKDNIVSKANTSVQEFKGNASGFGSSIRDSTQRVAEDFRESIEKITQRFKL